MTSPLHFQLTSMLRDRIVAGLDRPGSMLPTEHALIERYGISRTVVRQAMQSLAAEGLIVRIAGKGTFVRDDQAAQPQTWSVGSLDELLAFGLDTRLDILSRREVAARASIGKLLGIPTGAAVLEIRGLRSSDAGVFSYQSNYFLRDIGRLLARADLSRGSLIEAVQERASLKLTHAEQTVMAAAADAETARLLSVAKGSPVLIIQRVFVSEERGPIEVGIMRYRPDRFRYESKLTRSASGSSAVTSHRLSAAPHEGRRLTLVANAGTTRDNVARSSGKRRVR